MTITFDHGNPDQPRGHALLYYRSGAGYAATYIVVLPIDVDFAKYVPPVFANQIKMSGFEQFAAFAMPPMPEAVKSYQFMEDLAQRRNDDLVFGGEVQENDFLESAQRVNDDVHEYANLYQEKTAPASTLIEGQLSGESASELNVSDVMYSLMSEKDRLGELSKLVGKLRFAIEGADHHLVDEAEAEMRAIANHLPENYNVAQIIESSRQTTPESARMVQLYLERCYKLSDADYLGLASVEKAIQELHEEPT